MMTLMVTSDDDDDDDDDGDGGSGEDTYHVHRHHLPVDEYILIAKSIGW